METNPEDENYNPNTINIELLEKAKKLLKLKSLFKKNKKGKNNNEETKSNPLKNLVITPAKTRGKFKRKGRNGNLTTTSENKNKETSSKELLAKRKKKNNLFATTQK